MGIPLFLIFAVYGVVNSYLPILLFRLGYSATMIGILQGVFEAAGLVFPILFTSKVDRKGTYGSVMLFLGFLMLVVLPPLVLIHNVWVTALVLAIFAVGFKGAVPVADALVSRMLGANKTNYGKVRVLGSIGFVCMALLLQFAHLINPEEPVSIALWTGIPVLLFMLSIIAIPDLRKKYPPIIKKEGDSLSTATGIAILRDFPFSFWLGILLIFFGFLGLTPSQRFFSLYVQEYLHLKSYAGLWALSAAAEVPFMFLSGRFIRKFGTEKILLISFIAIVLRNSVYAVFPTFGGAVAGQLFHSVCFGLFHPAAVVFITERVPKNRIAMGLTLYSSVAVGIASVIGNVTGGIIIDSLGYRMLFVLFSIFPLISITLFYFFRDRLYNRN